METAVYCAVDVFAMISGYVMIKTKFNGFKILPLWLTVFFYSAGITLLFKFIPQLSALYTVSNKELIKGVLYPLLSGRYWYFTAYFGIYFFIPFVNKLLLSINKKEHRFLCIIIIAIFSLLPILSLKKFDSFNIMRGYTPVWLLCMYVIGAYLRLYPVSMTKIKCFILYSGSVFCAWFAKFISYVLIKFLFHKNMELDLFIDYTSIFIIISGAALLILFSQLKIGNIFLQKIIGMISPLAFSVYIIHINPVVFNYFLKNKFSEFAIDNSIMIIIGYRCFICYIYILFVYRFFSRTVI